MCMFCEVYEGEDVFLSRQEMLTFFVRLIDTLKLKNVNVVVQSNLSKLRRRASSSARGIFVIIFVQGDGRHQFLTLVLHRINLVIDSTPGPMTNGVIDWYANN